MQRNETATGSLNHPAVDWQAVTTVLLDMDGTLLDLRFDTWFWTELVPDLYGRRNGLSRDEVMHKLVPQFEQRRGTLEWYSLDFWATTLDLDLQGLKHNAAQEIRFLPGATRFLTRLRMQGKRLVLVTNAHDGILKLKLARTGLASYFDALYTSHDFGVAKESAEFWGRLNKVENFARQTSLFADDSMPVLKSATDYGIRHVVGIRKPDSTRPAAVLPGIASVDALVELID